MKLFLLRFRFLLGLPCPGLWIRFAYGVGPDPWCANANFYRKYRSLLDMKIPHRFIFAVEAEDTFAYLKNENPA